MTQGHELCTLDAIKNTRLWMIGRTVGRNTQDAINSLRLWMK